MRYAYNETARDFHHLLRRCAVPIAVVIPAAELGAQLLHVSSAEHFLSPPIVDMLDSKVRLVGAVVSMSLCEALS